MLCPLSTGLAHLISHVEDGKGDPQVYPLPFSSSLFDNAVLAAESSDERLDAFENALRKTVPDIQLPTADTMLKEVGTRGRRGRPREL